MSKTTQNFGLALSFAVATLLSPAGADATTLGQKRCMMLDKQLSAAMQSAKPSPSKSVSAMAQKARGLCVKGKSSQGLRAYAKALKAMGLQPALPDDPQTPSNRG